MTVKRKLSHRVLCLFLSIALVISCLPIFSVAAAEDPSRVSDPSTVEQWKQYFPVEGNITTQNAGGIWSDKSVFTENATIDGKEFTLKNQNNFLVALSAIGSNMTVTGMGMVPTDVMFVLDVSGSMADENNNAAEGLVSATNASIKSLLEANPYSRVGVVLYSGPGSAGSATLENATVILPLQSYRTDDEQGRYLNYSNSNSSNASFSNETVSVNDNVYYEIASPTSPSGVRKQYAESQSKRVVGGTYIQAGLALAEDEFLKSNTTVTPEGMGTVTRMPAIVLMSDGAVSLATDTFHNPDSSNMGDGREAYTTYDMGFVTQLTAAHTKYKVSSHYGTNCLFYTLGMINPNNQFSGAGTNMSDYEVLQHRKLLKNVAHGVLDPDNTAKTAKPELDVDNTQLKNRWTAYSETVAGDYYSLQNYSKRSVLRVSDAELAKMPMNYVTKFFDANDYKTPTSGTLGDALSIAFKEIVKEISLQSVYHPTLVENGSADLSGYISFVDKLGQYMKASDIKGIMTGGTLFTGEKLAKAFYDAFSGVGGDLGLGMGEGTPLGEAFISAFTARLGVDQNTAFAILQNAWKSGDISYTDANNYSNSFGWVSNSTGAYIQPWNETDNGQGTNYHIIPSNAAYVNRSYIFLGAEGDTDMMYATVRVREKVVNGVLTGEQEVNFAIPASLLPTITYNVDLDENGNTTNITVDKDTPIHLVYEVGLDPEINKFNVTDKVDPQYIKDNTDENGNILFYTNAWERDGSTGYNKVNTYSYFRPSHQNDRYYYQNDSLVYSNTSGTEYTGTLHPAEVANETFYYYHTYYANTNEGYKTIGEYHAIPTDVLSVAVASGSTWTIKSGTIRSDYSGSDADIIHKDDSATATAADGNKTGTLAFSHQPFADSNSYAYDDTSHNSVIGATLANNGRYALTPETGVRITKSLATDVNLGQGENPDFTFEIEYAGQNSDLEAYAYRFVNGQLTGKMETVSFAGGKATVTLKAGETLYIGGMSAGEVKVSETTTLDYIVQTVSVDGQPINGTEATITLAEGEMKDIDFINARRGTGILNIAKSVTFPDGVDATSIAAKKFTAIVNLSWNGAPLANYTVNNSNGQPYGTTDKSGNLTNVVLSHGQQVTLYGIPEGTVATVTEDVASLPLGFDKNPVYWENGTLKTGGTNAVVSISSTANADVMVRNTYNPTNVTTSFNVDLIKDFFAYEANVKNEVPIGTDEKYDFTFTLQARDIDTGLWSDIGAPITVSYTKTNNAIRQVSNEFTSRLQNLSYSKAGIYRYRIIETLGTENHIIYDQRAHSFGVEVADTDANGAWEIVQPRTSTPDVVTIAPLTGSSSYEVDVIFENEYSGDISTTAVIEIQKTVNDPAGVVYKENNVELAEGFEFTVYKYDPATKTTYSPGLFTQSTNTGGITRFTLNYTTDDIYYYVIKETKPAKEGWTYAADQYVAVEVSTDSGVMTATAYIIDEDGNAPTPGNSSNFVTVPFENTYSPAAAKLDLNFVSKQLNGREFNSNDAFTFEIKGVNGSVIYGLNEGVVTAVSNNTITGKATATSGNKASVNFNDSLYFGKVGTYYYAINETSTDGNGIVSDKTVYRITVTVTDDGTGALKASYDITSIVGDQITFVNNYTAEPATLSIEGTKSLTGRVMTENDFQFILTPTGTNNPHTVKYAVNAIAGSDNSSFSFSPLTYTAPGTYTYKVSEYNPTKAITGYFDGIKYDETVFDVTVTVADNGLGKLTATYTVDGSDTKKIAFANEYVPTAINVPISGIKDILGRGIVESDKFTFDIFEASYESSTNKWSKIDPDNPKESVNNIGGAISFTPISISKAGVYRYMVSERIENSGGITYDATTWRVAIIVTDDGNGKLTPEVRYMNDSGRQNAMIFLNTYTLSDGFTEISGHKELENKRIENEQFKFNLFETDNSFTVAEGAEPKDFVKNDAEGDFAFRLNYTKADAGNTYYYVVTEQNFGKQIDGILYSSNKYLITVTVADNYDGTLKIDKTITLDTETKSSLEFKNTYSTIPTTAVIEGTKKLTGRDMTANDKFDFELYNSTVTGAPEALNWVKKGDAYKTVKNNGEVIKFEAIEGIEAGKTYCYIVSEKEGAKDKGIGYDTTDWYVMIVGKDNGDGTVSPEISYYKGGQTKEPMVFLNTYTVANKTLPIEGIKDLEGRELKDGEFTFELYKVADNTFTIAEGQNPDKTSPNGLDKKFTFNLEYTKDDIGNTYYYVIKEANNESYGVTYSDAKYHLTVKVSDNGDGTLKLEKSIQLGTQNVDEIKFTNTYKDSTGFNVNITKKVDNIGSESITPEGFQFLLKKVGTDESFKVTSDENGKASIALSFTEKDIGNIYTYELTEVKGDKENVTYSTVKHTFTVAVELDENDKLVANTTFNEKAVETVEAEFVNVYDYTPPTPPAPPTTPESPKTGDFSNIHLWFALFFISGTGIFTTSILGKRKSNEEK